MKLARLVNNSAFVFAAYAVLTGCSGSEPINGTLKCGTQPKPCPDGFTCSARTATCWKNGTEPAGDDGGSPANEVGKPSDAFSPIDGLTSLDGPPNADTSGADTSTNKRDGLLEDGPGPLNDGSADVASDGLLIITDVAPLDTGIPDVPIGPTDTNTPDGLPSACTSPKINCNGVCVDLSANGCCVSTDCSGTCRTCGTDHVCTAAKSQDDPAHHCAGTCDATGTCKSKQGQTCKTASECANGKCVDGYCCDSDCTGSCQACNVGTAPGTCTTLAPNTAPIVGHPPCTGTDVCAGKCTGAPDCTYPTGTTSCGTASCSSSNVYQGTGTCNAGTCNLPLAQTCSNACVVAQGCVGDCKPGKLSCYNSATPELCDNAGTYQPQSQCLPGYTCSTTTGTCQCNTPGNTDCTTSCTNLLTDNKNCGTCGHDCQGGACTNGACQPLAITQVLSVPPAVFGVDSQFIYYEVPSSTVSNGYDAYKISKTAVGGTGTFLATVGVFLDFSGVLGQTIFDYEATGGASYMTIGGSSGFTPVPSGSGSAQFVMWGSVPPRYLAVASIDYTNLNFTINWYNPSASFVRLAGYSESWPVPSTNYSYTPLAGGDSVYWIRKTSDGSGNTLSSALFTVSVSNTTPIQLAGLDAASSLAVVDVNAKSVLLADGSSIYRVALPATSSTGSPQSVNLTSAMYFINATEDGKGIYWIDSAYSLYRCGAGNCGGSTVRLATDQPTTGRPYTQNTLFQDDTALYWGRSAAISGTGANQVMRLVK